jgi:Protein of unknown function (DUF1592)/Protein of unknown function (DUF1588)/Protein of unknown function (DUF1585)/Protein of unknown function (DUF1595)/Protein of unknown function (DUF1587)/Planctomycete cytochrome C
MKESVKGEYRTVRLFITSLVCLLPIAYVAVAQKREVATSESSRVPSLRDARQAGIRRSIYRKQLPQTGTSSTPVANLKVFRKEIEPVLKKTCVRCHGPKTHEGNIRIDTLNPDLLHGKDVNWWIEIAGVLGKGEMPPADAPKLADKDRTRLIEWLTTEIQLASAVRRAQGGHSSFRRMTRYEYNYALQDLLGLPYNFAKDLPPEPASEDGFQNSSEMLHMSAIQFGIYRELSRNALRLATVQGERPAPLYWGVTMKGAAGRQHSRRKNKAGQFRGRPRFAYYKNLKTGEATRAVWSYPGARYAWKPSRSRPDVPKSDDVAAVIPPRQKLIVELGDRIPERGLLRVRVRASRTAVKDNYVPSLRLEFGWQASNDSQASVRISDRDLAIDAAPGKPRFYHWEVALNEIYPRNSVRKISKMGDLPSPSEYVKFVNSSVTRGDIQIDYVEITSPVYRQWPPKSQSRIFFASQNKANETVYAREVLTRFMSRAWRRRVTAKEVDQKLALFTRIRPNCRSLQEAVTEVLATVLSSPKFLYLVRTGNSRRAGKSDSGRLSDSELATRLSMFLWSSIPDDKLLKLAEKKRLHDPGVLRGQVKRMLADARSRRFSRQFVRQWLGLQLLDHLQVDRTAYPQFDPALKEAMQQEPVVFFHEVLQNNRSVLDFVHADYAMVNERLAKHYGLNDVYGNEFRRVQLAPQSRRGGLLTQAGLLAMNSDGKDSHPLKRGVWLLKNLLNDPPPPPPPAVPRIDLADPRIAKMTLKERIANHRNQAACKSCHAKIDPWGIAFENFDAVGSWRTEVAGKPVDASSRLFNRQKLDGMHGLKRFLLANRQDQFARAMVHKLTTYALGRPLTFGDRSSIDQMTADSRKQGDGLATLITVIVTSDLFRSR